MKTTVFTKYHRRGRQDGRIRGIQHAHRIHGHQRRAHGRAQRRRGLRREPHGRNLGQGSPGARFAATHHDQRRFEALRRQGAVHLHAQRPRGHRRRHPGLPRRRRNLHALRQRRQYRQGLEAYLRRGKGLRHGGGPRQGALQCLGRDLPAGRAGTAGYEDRAEDVCRAGGRDGVLYL